MTIQLLLLTFALYSIMVFVLSHIVSRRATNRTYFIGDRSSPWFLVAYGMIGASLSGVTFMSVPGWIKDAHFTYLMMVFGYLAGYLVIASILLPLYYRLNLTSIYTYLEQRFGNISQKSGALLFFISRSLGSSLRMYLVIFTLHSFLLQHYGVSFFLTAIIFIVIILLYTVRGGIKTIVYTDTLQTTFMIGSVILTLYFIAKELQIPFTDLFYVISKSDYAIIIETDWSSKYFFLKQFFSGMFITIVMTGLDQEMMQKNLTCRSLRDAQMNMVVFSIILVFVNLLFLFLGASLFIFADIQGITLPSSTDQVFPHIAINVLGPFSAIVFFIGLLSASYSSADGTITSLTTAFIYNILGKNNENTDQRQLKNLRRFIHFAITLMLLSLIIIFYFFHNRAVIDMIFTIAGYTYGPLLGLFAFGIITRFAIRERWLPFIVIFSPLLCWLISKCSPVLFGYHFGFELLILNGLITFAFLYLFRKKV